MTKRVLCTKIHEDSYLKFYLEGLSMFEKLAKLASNQLEIDIADITPDSTFESLGIDSLDVVEMIMDLESELGVELELEDQKIVTFGELADFVESKVN